jgi:hypothetical protein
MTKFQKTYRRIAPIFAILIFFSTSGISINLHYCEGVLKERQLLTSNIGCQDSSKNTEASCCSQKQDSCCSEAGECGAVSDDSNCCFSQSSIVKLDLDLPYSSSNLEEVESQITTSAVIYAESPFFNEEQIIKYQYKPPLLLPLGNLDRFIAFQSFLC